MSSLGLKKGPDVWEQAGESSDEDLNSLPSALVPFWEQYIFERWNY